MHCFASSCTIRPDLRPEIPPSVQPVEPLAQTVPEADTSRRSGAGPGAGWDSSVRPSALAVVHAATHRATNADLLIAGQAGIDLALGPARLGVVRRGVVVRGARLERSPTSRRCVGARGGTAPHPNDPGPRQVLLRAAYSGVHSRGVRIRRPRRLMACVARAATPIATMARSAVGSGRTADRNWSARERSTTRRIAWPRGVSRSVRWRRSSGSWCRSTRRRRTRPSMSRLVADGLTARSPRPARRRSSCCRRRARRARRAG